jgi:hypothetical protein
MDKAIEALAARQELNNVACYSGTRKQSWGGKIPGTYVYGDVFKIERD